MLRSTASKVMWVGRATVFMVGLSVILALVFGVATTALSATGGNFILGKAKNAATKVTGLVGNVDGAALRVTNPNAGTNDTALDLRVQAGEAPLMVNSTARVANLNAATAGRADSAASADNATNAQNAETLDGKDSSEFANATHAHSGADITTGTVAEGRIDQTVTRDGEVMSIAKSSDGPGSGLDADQLDNKDSTAFGIGTEHSTDKAKDCDTAATRECAPIEIVVPTGKTYVVSVWSSANFSGYSSGGQQNVSYCSAVRQVDGPFPDSIFCITPSSSSSGGNSSGNSIVTLPQDQFISVSSSGEKTLTAGTWVISTLISPAKEFGPACCDDVITKVLVRDASGPKPSGISRR